MYSAMTTPSMNNSTAIMLNDDLCEIYMRVNHKFVISALREQLPVSQAQYDAWVDEDEEATCAGCGVYIGVTNTCLCPECADSLLAANAQLEERPTTMVCDCGRNCEDYLNTCWHCHFIGDDVPF